MAAIEPIPNPAEPRRLSAPRPLWVGLAACLLVVVLIGMPFYRQQSAIWEIERLGGTIQTIQGGPEWLRRWIGDDCMQIFDKVESVILDERHVADAGMAKLTALQNLKYINFANSDIADAGLANLGPLRELTGIDLSGTRVTDAGVAHLRALTRLEFINLNNTNISDVGLEHLAGLTNLQRLDLLKTRVTDAGLLHLYGLTKLHKLEVRDTRVTYENAIKLKLALPSLSITAL